MLKRCFHDESCILLYSVILHSFILAPSFALQERARSRCAGPLDSERSRSAPALAAAVDLWSGEYRSLGSVRGQDSKPWGSKRPSGLRPPETAPPTHQRSETEGAGFRTPESKESQVDKVGLQHASSPSSNSSGGQTSSPNPCKATNVATNDQYKHQICQILSNYLLHPFLAHLFHWLTKGSKTSSHSVPDQETERTREAHVSHRSQCLLLWGCKQNAGVGPSPPKTQRVRVHIVCSSTNR